MEVLCYVRQTLSLPLRDWQSVDEKPGSDHECYGRVNLGAGGSGVTWLVKKVLVSVRKDGLPLDIRALRVFPGELRGWSLWAGVPAWDGLENVLTLRKTRREDTLQPRQKTVIWLWMKIPHVEKKKACSFCYINEALSGWPQPIAYISVYLHTYSVQAEVLTNLRMYHTDLCETIDISGNTPSP